MSSRPRRKRSRGSTGVPEAGVPAAADIACPPSNGEHARMNRPAGNFSEWLRAMRGALAGGPGMDVACGDCVGCCTSSYFIKIRAHETRALAAIDPRHLADAPGPG